MQRSQTTQNPARGFAIAAIGLATTSLAWAQGGHDHHTAVPEMDADGKRLASYTVRHDVDESMLQALRRKIPLYRGMSEREIEMNMSTMGPNYEWYVSDRELRGEVGVLLLAHGVGQNSDRMFRDSVDSIAARHPTAIAFGMAMMTSSHLQSAVDDLSAAGAKKVLLVPTGTTTVYNTLTRQWQYIFGQRDDSTYLEVPRVTTPVEYVMTDHFSDHPLISEIIYDHAKEASKDPSREVVIIVGHGPEDINDNGPDLELLSAHVERIAAKQEFAEVRIINLQDDALPPIRKSNVKKLRRWVQTAERKDQDVIVVAIAVASHGVQAHIRQDLRGLKYTFADKGMSQHPKYLQWLDASIAAALPEG